MKVPRESSMEMGSRRIFCAPFEAPMRWESKERKGKRRGKTKAGRCEIFAISSAERMAIAWYFPFHLKIERLGERRH